MSLLRIMTQNQWNCTDNKPAWQELSLNCSAEVRMRGHIEIFKELMPDICGGQEVNKDMQLIFKLYCIEEGLPYTIIWGNMTPIIYRADKLELLDTEYLLYPIEVPGFEGRFNDVASKSCNLGVFRNKESGKIFIFATTHLWWKNGTNPERSDYLLGSDEAREYQVKLANELIEKYRQKYGMCPAILVGDMNSDISSPALKYLTSQGGFENAHDIATDFTYEGMGYCDCFVTGPAKEWRPCGFDKAIDHIFIKGHDKGIVKRYDRLLHDFYLLVSDHAPLYADIDL